MFFPIIYLEGSLIQEELSTKLISYRVLLYQISRPIGAILMSQKSFSDKFKSCLTACNLGKTSVHARFLPFWYLWRMELGICVLILGSSTTLSSSVDLLFHDWMTCLMSYMVPRSFPKLTFRIAITKLGWKKEMNERLLLKPSMSCISGLWCLLVYLMLLLLS